MSEKPSSFIQSAVLEVRYARGLTYLNRCGILAQKLHDALGQPFRVPGLPTTDHGELRSDAERLVVRFGRESYSVTQLAPQTAARIEQVAPSGWTCVRDDLGVERDVVRCGFRVIAQWRAKDIATARRALWATGLVRPSDAWVTLAGEPSYAGFTGVAEDPSGAHTRIAVDAIEQRVDGQLPAGYEDLWPPAVVQLDVDSVYPSENRKTFSVGPGQLKEFLRASWERSKELRAQFARLIEPHLEQ